MRSDAFLPDWLESGIEPSLRDTEEDIPILPAPLSISSTQQQRSNSSRSSALATPVVLTPVSSSPVGQNSGLKTPTIDLDKFYEDDDEEDVKEEEEEDGEDTDDDDDTDDGDGSEDEEEEDAEKSGPKNAGEDKVPLD